jgi:hypothetical protein
VKLVYFSVAKHFPPGDAGATEEPQHTGWRIVNKCAWWPEPDAHRLSTQAIGSEHQPLVRSVD